MKIISKFKDFYDIGNSYQEENDIFYLRDFNFTSIEMMDSGNTYKRWQNEQIDLNWISYQNHHYFHSSYSRNLYGNTECVINFKVIGFCGKLYPVILLQPIITSSNVNEYPSDLTFNEKILFNEPIAIFYSYDEFKQFERENIDKISNIDYFYNENKSKDDNKKKDELVKRFFDVNNFKEMEGYFHQFNTPIFVFDGIKRKKQNAYNKYNYYISLNAQLKTYQFYRKFEPFLAFQEISMFVGGVLKTPEKTLIQITDKDKIQQHGFDPKYGFRKPPNKKT